jgi:2-dehydro-3-deoxyphosphooctonate aldolase (KDO 8-P synthase)
MLLAAGRTGRVVNIKKGQFVAPHDIHLAAEKVASTGNDKVLLTERGASFGYNNLVVDMRGFAQMKAFGVPLCFDATHSVQLPGGSGDRSGGQREFVVPLTRSALAQGIAAVFWEVHPRPEEALSDGPNMIPLGEMPKLLRELKSLDDFVKSQDHS